MVIKACVNEECLLSVLSCFLSLLLNVVIPCLLSLFLKVWFPETTICRAESSAKTWRERGDFSSCDRLDREEIGAGVSGKAAVSSSVSRGG